MVVQNVEVTKNSGITLF